MTGAEIRQEIKNFLNNQNLEDTVSFRDDLNISDALVSQLCTHLGDTFDEANFGPGNSETLDSIKDFIDFLIPSVEVAGARASNVNAGPKALSGIPRQSLVAGRSNQAGAAVQPTVAAEADSESTGGTTLKEFLKKHNLDQFLGVYTFHHNFLVLRLESSGKGLFATWISKEAHLIGALFELDNIREPNENLPDQIAIASGELIGDSNIAVSYDMVAKFTETGGAQVDILPTSGTSKHGRVELSAEEPSAEEPSVCQGNLFVSSNTKEPITLKMRHFE